MVYSDEYISRDTGRLYHTKGKSYPSEILSGGCVFIDHTSSYVIIKHQVAISATVTVKANPPFIGRIKFRDLQSRDTTLIMGSSMPQSL